MTAAGKPTARKPRAVQSISPVAVPAPVGDDVFTFHPDELTIGQIEDVEAESGMPFDWLYDREKPKAAIMRAIAYVLCKESDPSFTMEKARAMRVFVKAEPSVPPTRESA